MKTRTVGVLGAGVMGRGVAQALAQTNHQVVLIDRTPDILAGAEQSIRQNTRLMRLFDKYKVRSTFCIPGHTIDTWPEPRDVSASTGATMTLTSSTKSGLVYTIDHAPFSYRPSLTFTPSRVAFTSPRRPPAM